CRPGRFHAASWRIAAGEAPVVGIRLLETAAGQHRRVLERIAEGLASARSLPVAECQAASLATVLTEICDMTGWAYAEAWLPLDERDGQWLPHPFWYGSRDRYQAFRDLSVKAAAAAPLPLVSRVAREQSSLWYSDVSVVPLAVYRRARGAREAGLRATFAQPVVEAGRTLAVLVFMMAEARARDDLLAGLMADVARQLAPLFRRAPARLNLLRAAEPRSSDQGVRGVAGARPLEALCRLLDGLDKAALVTDHDVGCVAWSNKAADRMFRRNEAALCGMPVAQLHADAEAFEEFSARALALAKAGKSFRHRARLQRGDGTRFAGENFVVPLGEIAGSRLSVALVTDLGETARLTFGGRLDQLSARELEVFQLTIVGATVPEIASHLAISSRTVEVHRSNLLRKLGCASTTKLLAELLADSVTERAGLHAPAESSLPER
ncbi:MAG TPA: LuxR C-terminal-related transcriptional regulator, partial [Kiloniellaceae bacterium]|nr:LuxR C-terminal-related transcriptional regulator [Kiloniellaceae bacterium]